MESKEDRETSSKKNLVFKKSNSQRVKNQRVKNQSDNYSKTPL